MSVFGVSLPLAVAVFSVLMTLFIFFLQKRKSFGFLSWLFTPICLVSSIFWLTFSAGVILDIIEVSHISLKF